MISKAGFEAKTELVKGKSIHLQVGELRASERFLAEEWDWSRSKVTRFLDRIEQIGYIGRRTENGEGIVRLKRFIVGCEPPNEPAIEPLKRQYKVLTNISLDDTFRGESNHQTNQQPNHWRTTDEPPINNKEKNKNNENKGRENPPYPPFSEKGKSDFSFESPKKEELPLSTEREEKEKSWRQKEKEVQEVLEGGKSDLSPSDALNDSLWNHHASEEGKLILEGPSGLKTDPGSAYQPARAMQEAKTGFSGVPRQQKLFGELRYPFASEKFTKAWGLWKRYKGEEHGFKYKSALSEQMALNALYKLSQGKEAGALSIIEQSMANGWEGLFELKNPSPEQGVYPSALEKLRSDQILFEGFAMKYVSQLARNDFEHFCGQWNLSQESQGGWEEKGKRQLLAGLEKYLNSVIYRKKREEKTEHHAIDISKSTIRKLG